MENKSVRGNSPIEKMLKRRSIRAFKPTPIPEELITQLKRAATCAPSSRNKKPWHFRIVNNPDLLKKLSRCKATGAEFLENAPLAIVVSGNASISDVWIEDCSVASWQIQLAAHFMGLGSCWVQIRNRQTADGKASDEYIRTVLHIPRHLQILSIIALGYADEEKQERSCKNMSGYFSVNDEPLS